MPGAALARWAGAARRNRGERLNIRSWMRMAAAAGITPDRFWRMTMREIVIAIEGRARAMRDEWVIARQHAAWIITAIRGVAGDKNPETHGTDLLRFPDEQGSGDLAFDDGDYQDKMKALKAREESAIFWGSELGAPVADILDETPYVLTRGRDHAIVAVKRGEKRGRR